MFLELYLPEKFQTALGWLGQKREGNGVFEAAALPKARD
jgi:hypothetical protein